MIARSERRSILTAALVAALCTACASGTSSPEVTHKKSAPKVTHKKSVPEVTHDGLTLVPGSKMERAWVKPGEDFSQYSRIGLLDCFVAFKKNWQLNHFGARTHDMERIKKELAEEFRKVFSAELEKSGYPISTSPGKDVLLVRPAIINLDVAAPDNQSGVSSITFTTSAGSMELYVELYDSVSNEILARAADRRQASHIGDLEQTSRGTNSDDARRLLKHWADLLIKKLDEVHGKTGG
jgi:hypothetical protein